MPVDEPRFVPELNIPETPSMYSRAVSALKSRLGRSVYQEVFGEKIYPAEDGQEYSFPTKVVLKDGIRAAEVRLHTYWQPKQFLNPVYVPGFAVGNCVDISNGNYKHVIIDEEGQSDTVIKRYHRNTYWGDGAEDRAAAAANKLDRIYAVIGEICPQYLLPVQRFSHQMPYAMDNLQGWAVFERQQRAIFVSPWLCEEPKRADEIVREQKRVSAQYHDKIISRLIRTGICQKASSELSEVSFGVSYDFRTRSLKEGDIIDYVELKQSPR